MRGTCTITNFGISGEKLSDEEVEMLTTGMEDSQGNVNYEGTQCSLLIYESNCS